MRDDDDEDEDDMTRNCRKLAREGFAEDILGVPPSLTDMVVNAARNLGNPWKKQLRAKSEDFGKTTDGSDQPDEAAGAGLGFQGRTGAMGTRGRDVDDRQAIGGGFGVAAGGYDSDEGNTLSVRRAAADATRGNATYDKRSLLDPDGEGIGVGPAITDRVMPAGDGRSIWPDDQQGSASYPDSAYDDYQQAGWPALSRPGMMEEIIKQNASPRLLAALRNR